MPVDDRPAVFAEGADHQVRHSPRDRQEALVAAAAMKRDSGLHEVSGAVELVRELGAVERHLARRPLHIRVEVTVRQLHPFEQAGHVGQHRGPLVGAGAPDLPADRLEGLVEVGVREPEPRNLPSGVSWPASSRRRKFAMTPVRSTFCTQCGIVAAALSSCQPPSNDAGSSCTALSGNGVRCASRRGTAGPRVRVSASM